MEIRSRSYRVATVSELRWNVERGEYEHITDAHDETVYFGVEIVGGEAVPVTAEYRSEQDVPGAPDLLPAALLDALVRQRDALTAEITRLTAAASATGQLP